MSDRREPALWCGDNFALHFAVFGAMLPVLAVVDLLVGERWWVHWALLGWGAAVLTHAFFVFGSHRDDHADVADADQQRAA